MTTDFGWDEIRFTRELKKNQEDYFLESVEVMEYGTTTD